MLINLFVVITIAKKKNDIVNYNVFIYNISSFVYLFVYLSVIAYLLF